ncbi:MAG: hypothetical protein Q9218_003371 [Villophora microphyllina]
MAAGNSVQNAANSPDLMNDPEFDPDANGKRTKSMDDVDTCRICRSEGSAEEPLFYPCKCSGSIKFVHQNCLMEWLSHSQKKHCELCKTPFRFTKLYHPQMPSTVPTLIFLRQVIIHTWRSLVAWSRMIIVVFVWLGWLPWSIRTVWRGLFWIGDGGWINWAQLQEQALTAAREQLATEGITPAAPISLFPAEYTASFLKSRFADALPRMVSPTLNLTQGEPILFSLAKSSLRSIMGWQPENGTMPSTQSLPSNATHVLRLPYRASWLSEVSFLRTWTRWPILLNCVIDMLEGQIITMCIVIAFILIFLIREWVVQQQPAANLPVAIEGQAPILAIEEGDDRLDAPQDTPETGQAHHDETAAELENSNGQDLPTPARGSSQENPSTTNPTEGIRHLDESNNESVNGEASSSSWEAQESAVGIQDLPNTRGRPSMPERGRLARAAEIRRTIEEQSRATGQDWPGLKVLTDLWTRADSSPTGVLRILEEEGRDEELGWVVAAMQRLESIPVSTEDPTQFPITGGLESDLKTEQQANEASTPNPAEFFSESDFGFARTASDVFEQASSVPTVIPNGNLPGKADKASLRSDESVEPKAHPNHQHLNQASKTETLSLQEFLDSDSAATPPVTQKNTYRALYEFAGQSETELTVSKDEVVEVVREESNGWCLTKRLDGSAQGWTPSAYLTPHQQETLKLTPPPPPRAAAPANANSNPFHPDYDGALPPHPLGSPIAEEPPLATDVRITAHNAADSSPPVATATNQASRNGFGLGQGFTEKIATWLWGEAIPTQAENQGQAAIDDERIVQDLANEAPFVPMEHGEPMLQDHAVGGVDEVAGPAPNPEVAADALQGALDDNEVEAIEEVEDLEGIMELVGMQGPIAGLVQNGMFCAVLIALTIFLNVWIPYIVGKLFLVVLTNPVSLLVRFPLRWMSSTADLLSDFFIFSLSGAYYCIATAIQMICSPLRKIRLMDILLGGDTLAGIARGYAERSLDRLTDALLMSAGSLSESDIPTFSIVAHESLRTIQHLLSSSVERLVGATTTLCALGSEHDTHLSGVYSNIVDPQTYKQLATQSTLGWQAFISLAYAPFDNASTWLSSIRQFNILRVNVAIPQRTRPLDFTLAHWDTRDRTVAILCGYLSFALIGFLYLRLGLLFQRNKKVGKVDGIVADVLYQAGGVMKVILIIGIEMIVFPLYCGILLDVALLPLFQDVTLLSRLEFMVDSPCTSLFIHWFVGTCYMFHFALFVSMCRKLMRTGVLYFIRDPDDPTFHPVREVLERSVFTQLCKIAFSALVYGGLVIVCLGGVIWGISSAFKGVFPIHWSSNEPVLEFPVDLLFYNFLMPLAMKVFKPADGLAKMYDWWFRKCARGLRLSHFMFGERQVDEEGHHVRRRWRDIFSGKKGDVKNPVIGKDGQQLAEDGGLDAYFLRDGRFVRTPSSDQVRIPKGAHTFVEVNEAGQRVDGQQDDDAEVHERNRKFSTTYIPPHFRLRIGAFIFFLWLFAATTGVSITLIPLVFGRYVFSHIFPSHPRMNDIYAFSIGISILGGATYLAINARRILDYIRYTLIPKHKITASNALSHFLYYTARLIRILYTYTAFGFLLPTLVALIPEFYVIIPLHTFFGDGTGDHHIIYFVQNWTLGVLYVKVIGHLILRFAPARPATAMRNIVQAGWTDPDIKLATRGFILPSTILLIFLLTMPLGFGYLVNTIILPLDARSEVYRYSYTAVLGMVLGVVVGWYAARGFGKWKRRIRDEVYLIGERLHNFGGVPPSTRVGT